MLVEDYQPKKRLGVEELDGLLNVLSEAVDEATEADEFDRDYYRGALIAVMCFRFHTLQYPRDFIAVFERYLNDLHSERGN